MTRSADSHGGQPFAPGPTTAGHVAAVRRVTWTGLAINVVLACLKFAAGLLGRSQAVIADAVHSLSDSTTDVAILVGVRYWSRPPDETHPYGHRRIETVITAAIGALLAAVAVGLAYTSLTTLHDRHVTRPGWIAFAAAVAAIAVKEALYQWTIRVGKRVRSAAVIANAWHHRSDALSSVPAALAVAGAAINPTWSFLDHVGAVIVSLFILHAAGRIIRPALRQLVDVGASRQQRERIRTIALETDGVSRVHALRTRYIGPGLQVDLHVLVDPAMSVRRGHDIAEAVERRLLDGQPDVVDVLVHIEPDEDGSATEAQRHGGGS